MYQKGQMQPSQPQKSSKQVSLYKAFLERKFHLGMGLSPEIRLKLKSKIDCFSWSHSNMTGIPLDVAIHKLSLAPNFPLVRQKK